MGNLSMSLLESPGGWDHRSNDNNDPRVINWKGFDTFPADSIWNSVVRTSETLGLDNYSLEGKINWNWTSPWWREIYRADRERCLDELPNRWRRPSPTGRRSLAASHAMSIFLMSRRRATVKSPTPTRRWCEISSSVRATVCGRADSTEVCCSE